MYAAELRPRAKPGYVHSLGCDPVKFSQDLGRANLTLAFTQNRRLFASKPTSELLSVSPLRLIAHLNFSLKNYSCELFNLIGTVGKVELISTFTTAVCESWNVSDNYTWDNAGDLKQLSMDQTLSEDNRSN